MKLWNRITNRVEFWLFGKACKPTREPGALCWHCAEDAGDRTQMFKLIHEGGRFECSRCGVATITSFKPWKAIGHQLSAISVLLIAATVFGADVRLICNANPPGEQVTQYGFWERTDGTNWTLIGTTPDATNGVTFQRPSGKYAWSATAFNSAGMSDYATPLEFELRDDSVTLKRPSAPVMLAAVIAPAILFPPGAGGEVRYTNNPASHYLSTMSQGDGGWYGGRFTTKANPSTFSTASFVYTNAAPNRWYGTGMGSFNTPYIGASAAAPGYGSTTYNSVRRLVIPTISNSLTTISGNINAASVSGRTLAFRVWHNSSLIYAYTNPASTAVNFNYGVTNIAVVTADTLSWEVDKTVGASVSGDVTFTGTLQ